MRSRTSLIGAVLVRRGDADAMLCGTVGNYLDHLKYVRRVIGLKAGVHTVATMQMLILHDRQLFFCDTHVNRDPDAAQIAEMTLLAAEQVRRFGMTPRVALVSHSSFGSSDAPSAQKMRAALRLINERGAGSGSGGRDARRLARSRAPSAPTNFRTRASSTTPTC